MYNDATNKIKIIDFGFACSTEQSRVFCGTPSYMCPEIVNRQSCTGFRADIWATGVVMYAMLAG